jgi:Calpain family cysteine protease
MLQEKSHERIETDSKSLNMIACTRTHIKLTEDIFLHTSTTSNPLTYTYELDNATPDTLRFTIFFEESENICAVQNGEVLSSSQLSTIGQPFQRSVVGILKQTNVSVSSRLTVGYEWEIIPVNSVDTARTTAICVRENDKIKILLSMKKDANKINERDSSDYIDVEFSPITDFSKLSVSFVGKNEYWQKQSFPIVLRRFCDFMDKSYDMFGKEMSPLDIRKGCLGDYGFLSAIACLAEHSALIKSFFVLDHSARARGKYGVFLHPLGQREVVCIDDYIPCYPEGGPVFARGHGNDVWVMLLQKACAKALGGYEFLKNIPFLGVLKLLTGVPCVSIVKNDSKTKKMIENDTLWLKIKSYHCTGSLMSLSVPSNAKQSVLHDDPDLRARNIKNIENKRHRRQSHVTRSGLRHGHTYAILKVKETKGGDRLIQLREPWGDWTCDSGVEWAGKWRDDSPHWTEEITVR